MRPTLLAALIAVPALVLTGCSSDSGDPATPSASSPAGSPAGATGETTTADGVTVTGAAGSTPPPGGSKSYNDIANHVASSQGAHGLNALAHAIGGLNSGWIIQVGAFNPQMGGGVNQAADGSVNFADTGVAFSGTPFVFLSWDGYSPNGWAQAQVRNRYPNGFEWRASCSIDGGHAPITTVYWLAIGPKAP